MHWRPLTPFVAHNRVSSSKTLPPTIEVGKRFEGIRREQRRYEDGPERVRRDDIFLLSLARSSSTRTEAPSLSPTRTVNTPLEWDRVHWSLIMNGSTERPAAL